MSDHEHGLGARWCRFRHAGVLRLLAAFEGRLPARCSDSFGILAYHRVLPAVAGEEAAWNVTPEQFRSQLEGLLCRNYTPWPLHKVLDYHRRGEPIPGRVFVVTFDDGYANVYHFAWPILKQAAVPAVVFVPTAYLDTTEPLPFDDWGVRRRPQLPPSAWLPLSSAQCAQMLHDGLIELGTHSHTHADFRGRAELLREELTVSSDLLRRRFGLSEVPFSFPYGRKRLGFSGGNLGDAAALAGVSCALTTESELVSPRTSLYDWGRFNIQGNDTAATIAARLDGWYTTLRDCWRWLRYWNGNRWGENSLKLATETP